MTMNWNDIKAIIEASPAAGSAIPRNSMRCKIFVHHQVDVHVPTATEAASIGGSAMAKVSVPCWNDMKNMRVFHVLLTSNKGHPCRVLFLCTTVLMQDPITSHRGINQT